MLFITQVRTSIITSLSGADMKDISLPNLKQLGDSLSSVTSKTDQLSETAQVCANLICPFYQTLHYCFILLLHMFTLLLYMFTWYVTLLLYMFTWYITLLLYSFTSLFYIADIAALHYQAEYLHWALPDLYVRLFVSQETGLFGKPANPCCLSKG